jgi:hypothetical protein
MNEAYYNFIMSVPFLVGLLAFAITGLITRRKPKIVKP